jgi:Flp pilus assembly pilin Flp
MKFFLNNFSREEGVTSVEYAIMVMLIAAVIVGSVTLLGTSTINIFSDSDLASAFGGAS